jgi:hypothetical protein
MLKKKNPKIRTMNVYEITYRPEPGSENLKVRVVSSNFIWASVEILKSKYYGHKRELVDIVDEGPIIVAERREELTQLLRERTDLLADVLDAIGKDIADITTDERLFEKHRKTLEGIAKISERLAEREKAAIRGPLV